jgi:hypothetical protein
MMRRISFLTALMAAMFVLMSCSSRDEILLNESQNQNSVNVIALMPVENKTQDTRLPAMLKTKISELLKFKGYPQVASDVSGRESKAFGDARDAMMKMQVATGMLKPDAAMYCTLKESHSSTTLFYAPATVALGCELRSLKTGDTLWKADHKSTSRSFDLIRIRLKMKTEGALEEALEEAVGKVIESLPYGPGLRG